MSRRLWAIVAGATLIISVSNWVSLGTIRQSCTQIQAAGTVEYISGCKYEGPGTPFQINSYGIIADEPELSSKPGQIDILYIGWTEPLPIDDYPLNLRVSRLLEEALNSQLGPNQTARVINGTSPGIDGGFSAEKVANLIRAYRPKMVLFLFLPNIGYLRDAEVSNDTSTEPNSYLRLQIRLTKLSWAARLSHNQTEKIVRPMLSEFSKIREIAQSWGVRFVFVWSGTGLHARQWGQRLPRTLEGLAARFLTVPIAPISLTPADVGQFLRVEAPDLVDISEVAHLFYGSRSWSAERSKKIAARLAEVLTSKL